jgi:hypothetical protein
MVNERGIAYEDSRELSGYHYQSVTLGSIEPA